VSRGFKLGAQQDTKDNGYIGLDISVSKTEWMYLHCPSGAQLLECQKLKNLPATGSQFLLRRRAQRKQVDSQLGALDLRNLTLAPCTSAYTYMLL
jgi:hypothetical protein